MDVNQPGGTAPTPDGINEMRRGGRQRKPKLAGVWRKVTKVAIREISFRRFGAGRDWSVCLDVRFCYEV